MSLTRTPAASILLLLGLVTHAFSAPRPAPVRLDGPYLVNTRSGYYFSVPSGWVLTDAADYHAVKLTHTESGATFDILATSMGTADLKKLYMALSFSLKPPEWAREAGGGDVSLGKRPAIEIRGTHLKPDQSQFKERIVLVQDGSLAYIVTSSVPQAAAGARAADIDQMFGSFGWGKPPKP